MSRLPLAARGLASCPAILIPTHLVSRLDVAHFELADAEELARLALARREREQPREERDRLLVVLLGDERVRFGCGVMKRGRGFSSLRVACVGEGYRERREHDAQSRSLIWPLTSDEPEAAVLEPATGPWACLARLPFLFCFVRPIVV